MANEPSLGELASAAQSQQPIPTTAPRDGSEGIRLLNQAAQYHSENEWRKFTDFQNRLGATLANVNALESEDVLPEDKPELMKDRAKLFEMIYSNPKAFTGQDWQKLSEIQSEYGNLVGKTTQSKSFNLFDKGMRGYVSQNETLNTDENKQIIESERSKPLAERKAYMLNIPPVFDATSFADTIKKSVTTSAFSPLIFGGYDDKGQPIKGEQFIQEVTTDTVPYDSYIQKWDASLNVQDKSGKPIQRWVQTRYNELPEEIKEKITVEDLWHKMGERLYGSTKDEKGTMKDIITEVKGNIQANPNYLKNKELGLAWYNAQTARRNQEDEKIENPAIQFGGHIERVKKYFNNNPNASALIVKYSALDSDTKKALGLIKKEDIKSSGNSALDQYIKQQGGGGQKSDKGDTIEKDSFITYFKDGSIRIGTDKKGNGGEKATLENLKQGYIDAIKSGLNLDGTQSEGFQKNAEEGFMKVFGTKRADDIFNGWGSPDIKEEKKTDKKNDPLGIF